MPKYGKIRLKVGGEMNNEKGVTLVELFAIILLVSLVIVPTLTALTGNFRVNASMIDRSTASSKASQTIQGFQNLDFNDLENNLSKETSYTPYSFSEGCSDLKEGFNPINEDIVTYPSNRQSCEHIFDTNVNDFEFGEDNIKVYLYPFAVEDEEAFKAEIDDSDLPDEVKNIIKSNISEGINIRIFRVVVWIEYGPNQTLVRHGLITPRIEVRP